MSNESIADGRQFVERASVLRLVDQSPPGVFERTVIITETLERGGDDGTRPEHEQQLSSGARRGVTEIGEGVAMSTQLGPTVTELAGPS